MSFIEDIEMIARRAGAEALRYFNREKEFSIASKSSYRDLVSSADQAVEKMIIKAIRDKYPEHAFFGEESGHGGGDSSYCWIIDPIDGTQSFVRRQPYFSISIALKHNETVVAGCVYAPRLEMMFTAEKGGGAFENGAPIRCSDCSELRLAAAATGFACLRTGRKINNMPICDRLFPLLCDVRRCGSAALDLCFVASGRYDAFWELELQEYDVAAGALIATEAGAEVRDISGGTLFPEQGIVCANPPLLRQFLPYFKPGFSG